MIDMLHEVWQVNRTRKTSNEANENMLLDENYLSDYTTNKDCFYCGKKGHLKVQCPKFKGKCGGRTSCKVC